MTRKLVLLAASSLVVACSTPKRVANTAWMVGGQVAPTILSNAESGTVGGITGKIEAAQTEDYMTVWGHAEAMLGGNTTGWAGQVDAEGELGVALFKPPHHLFFRGGLAGTVERDPYTGLFAIEVPTATIGYQFHGTGTRSFSDSMHFDIGFHGGLLAAARVFDKSREIDLVADPEIGGLATLMGELVRLRASYVAAYDTYATHIFRGSACLDAFFALCVDTRNVFATYVTAAGPTRLGAHFIGISFGFGLATGLDRY